MTLAVPTEDFLAVQDLLARYSWFIDSNRGEDWAALYTDDGVFEGTRPEPTIGRDALVAVPGQLHAMFAGRMRHQYGNLYVEPGDDANRLVAHFYNQVTTWGGEGGSKLTMLALCTAQLVRADQASRWRIARNTVELLR